MVTGRMLFDTNAQIETSDKSLCESVFAHLNRSVKLSDTARRALIEEWLFHLPESEQGKFCVRFRSGNDNQFVSAFHELFLHEFLRRQSCTLDFHPIMSGSSKRPEFLVHPPDGNDFILEARTSTEVASGPDRSPRGNRIRDALRQMKLDGYRLGIDKLSVGKSDLPQKALRKHIVDAIAVRSGKDHSIVRIPDYSTEDGWLIRLTAFPSRQYGSSHSGTIMYEAWTTIWNGPSYPLRDALKKKAGKYGQLTMPYVIAINSSDVMLTDCDLEETLFGVQPGTTIAGMADELARGFWGTESAPNHQRVSAVLFTKNLWPATVLTCQVYACLYLNPWPKRPYDGLLTQLPTFRFENGNVRQYSGEAWHELIKL
jgi:hypothetical protein